MVGRTAIVVAPRPRPPGAAVGAASMGESSTISRRLPHHDAERRESPRRHEDAGLERPHGLVVGLDARGQAALQRLHVAGHGPEPLVELRPQLLDLAGVLGHRLLPPAEGDRAQQGDEGDRRGEQHVVRHRVLLERGVGLEGGREQLVAGDEGDDHLRRPVELPPVLLLRQLLDVGAELPGVATPGAVRGTRRRPRRPAARRRRAAPWRRRRPARLPACGRSCRDAGVRPRRRSRPARRSRSASSMPAISATRRSCISPQRPRGLRRAERGDQVACLASGAALMTHDAAGPPSRSTRRRRPCAPPRSAGCRARSGPASRCSGDRSCAIDLLALGEVALGRRPGLVEPGVGQGEELLVVLRQRLGRQLGEGPRQPGAVRPRRGPTSRRPHGARARAPPPPRPAPSRPPRPLLAAAAQLRLLPVDGRLRIAQPAPRPGAAPPASRARRARCAAMPSASPTTRPRAAPRITRPM